LTLAGARRRQTEEGLGPADESDEDADVAALIDGETRQELRNVRRGLQWILGVLSGQGLTAEDFVLTAERSARASARPTARNAARGKAKPVRAARVAKKGKRR
jgi:hypothetical protein